MFHYILNEIEQIIMVKVGNPLVNMDQLLQASEFIGYYRLFIIG